MGDRQHMSLEAGHTHRKERGNALLRRCDLVLGIPLAWLTGAARKLSGHFAHNRHLPPQSIGVLCFGAIGDLLLATGLLRGLRDAFPDADIEVVVSAANAPVLPLLPDGFKVQSVPVTDLVGLVRHVRRSHYDVLLDTSQWARLGAVLCGLSGAVRTVGFRTAGQYRHYSYDNAVSHSDTVHEAANFLALGRALSPSLNGVPAIKLPQSPGASCPRLPEAPLVYCHMWPAGVRSHLKEWPAEYWEELAQRLLEAGYVLCFTGGKEDRERTETFLNQAGLESWKDKGALFNLAGVTSLQDLAFLLAKAAAVVSVNTGIMHLAALCNAPLVALHGPTNPLRWGPAGSSAKSLLPDAGNFAYLNLGFEYPENADNIMRNLPVSKVLSALESFGVGG